MTLQQLTDYWNTICLKHKDVKAFLIGTNFSAANNTDHKYPLCFWELPYVIDYPDWNKPKDTVQISLCVFLQTKQDDIVDDNSAISLAKSIGDAIISKVKVTATEFTIDAVNAISVREYSDDSVAGLRYDLTMTVIREICELPQGLQDLFND